MENHANRRGFFIGSFYSICTIDSLYFRGRRAMRALTASFDDLLCKCALSERKSKLPDLSSLRGNVLKSQQGEPKREDLERGAFVSMLLKIINHCDIITTQS